MNDLLQKYFDVESEVFDAFGYKHDWRVFPLQDHRDAYWYLDARDHLTYGYTPLTVELVLAGSEIYTANVFTYVHLKKWVYRIEQYTMILIDTHCDGNIFLAIFDNDKEVVNPSPEFIEACGMWSF